MAIGIICFLLGLDWLPHVHTEGRSLSDPLFTCTNSIKIWRTYLCDKVIHCSDASDEDPEHCKQARANFNGYVLGGMVSCDGNSGQYVRLTTLCDGFMDCINGNDERYCALPTSIGHEVVNRPFIDKVNKWAMVLKKPLPRDGVIEYVEFFLSNRKRMGTLSIDLYRHADGDSPCHLTLKLKRLPKYLRYGYNKVFVNLNVKAGNMIGFSWEFDTAIVFEQVATGDELPYCYDQVNINMIGMRHVFKSSLYINRFYSFRAVYRRQLINSMDNHTDECDSAFCRNPTNLTQCSFVNDTNCKDPATTAAQKTQSQCARQNHSLIELKPIQKCDDSGCQRKYMCLHTSMCIPLSALCNGAYNCPLGDDELNCYKCPDHCYCHAKEFYCFNDVTLSRSLPNFPNDLRLLDLSRYGLKSFSIVPFSKLMVLNMSRNSLSAVPWESEPRNIRVIDLSHNKIAFLTGDMLIGLTFLRELFLQENPVARISFDFQLLLGEQIKSNLQLKITYTEQVCCELFVMMKTQCRNITKYTGCSIAKGLQNSDDIFMISSFLGWMTVLLNCAHLILELLKKRSSHSLRLVLFCNTPLVGMGFGLYNILVTLAAMQHTGQKYWQSKWMESLLCRSLFWLATALHISNLVSILMATIYNYILTYVSIEDFGKMLKRCVALNVFTVLFLPTLVGTLGVAIPPLLKSYQSSVEELCNPLKLLVYFPHLTRASVASAAHTFTVIVYIGLTLGVLFLLVACFVFSCGKCMQEVFSNFEHMDEEEHCTIAADFSCYIMFSLLFDCASLTLVAWTCLSNLVDPPDQGWDQRDYILLVLVYIPCPKAIGPLLFVSVECYRFIAAHRSMSHVKGKPNSQMLKYMLSPHGNRRYEKLGTFLKKGGNLSPHEVLDMTSSLSSALLQLHNEGLVCDYINPDYIIVCLDNKNMLKKTDLVATTEYPKWDVYEWRKQRDVAMMGEVVQLCMQSLNPGITKRKLSTRGLSLKSFSIAR